jgi:hypothetical protein
MERDFGSRHITCHGLVVVGRRSDGSDYDRIRLDWRSEHTFVGGAKVSVFTYDDLFDWLNGRTTLVRTWPQMNRGSGPPKSD